jgi:glycosyltransferase involved in cell wall biosynthesis
VKIFVTGTRGIPDIPGGVEKHCEELFPRIAARGHEVLLCTRSGYVVQKINEWRGIRLINCYAPRIKSLEAIVHTFIALLKARWYCPDIVHIHAIGPSLLTPFARILGLKVVVTNHGLDYDRQKWGKLAKFALRLGEKMGGLYANEVIVISTVIADIIREGLHDFIYAFRKIDCDYKLVIAGDADHETDYSRNLRQMAAQDDRIIMTGYITGEPLNQLYSHARLFVLPSYHEGLPIVLLEAMSYGLPVLVSDIPANKEVELPKERYFRCGDVDDLKDKMGILLEQELTEEEQQYIRNEIEDKYNWDKIAEQTIEVYRKAIS